MSYKRILFKLLRYLLEASIIYLILRYAPYIKLDQTKSFIIAIILTIVCVVVEFLCIYIYSQLTSLVCNKEKIEKIEKVEKFNENNCDTCNIQKIDATEQIIPKNCKLVCENKKEKQIDLQNISENKNESENKNISENKNEEVDDEFGCLFYNDNNFYNKLKNKYCGLSKQIEIKNS